MPAWNASWISLAYDPREDLGVFVFRRVFDCDRAGVGDDGHPIRVSADNRYKLYCNGALVGLGPQRGDERHWFYETYDLAPFLKEGENELIALVWNFGWMAPMAQHTVRTAFVCEGSLTPQPPLPEGEGESLSTPGEWQVARVPGWDFDMMHNGVGEFYIDVGPGEIIEGRGTKVEGRDLLFDLSELDWRDPYVVCRAEDRGSNGGGTPWMLIPATLPPQRYDLRSDLPRVGGGDVGTNHPTATMSAKPLILDFGELLCAYPRIHASGPAGAELRVTYAESLWIPGTNEKGNRNETEGKEIRGYQDRFILSGGADVFEPLWWRTFRFVQVARFSPSPPNPLSPSGGEGEIVSHPPTPSPQSGEGELQIRLEVFETGYPYAVDSSFEADDPWVKPIWDVSVRTAQRCAGETYFDCPYYEQLQYVGDSRIQALIGYYLGRDRRLQRNCIEQIGWSLMENGLTQSRYPSRQTQVIPPFSLWWVMMLYDQMLYDSLNFSLDKQTSSQIWEVVVWHWRNHWNKRSAEFWCFGDWVQGWRWGVPPGSGDNPVCILLEDLADKAKGGLTTSKPIERLHEQLRDVSKVSQTGGLITKAWSGKWPGAKVAPTEHAEALYRLLQISVGKDPDPWPTEALERANAAKCTYYFSYYKHLAMFGAPEEKATRSHTTYLDQLQPWKEQIENGLTTFAENPEPTRSDCHAWSAHPILGFFQIVAGVTSIAPGWKKSQIRPHPGNLRRFDAQIAHPDGELRVMFEDGRLEICSPVPATLKWQGKTQELEAGRHRI